MLINQKKLDLYISMNYNVLFKGRPGVGKTSIIHDTFTRNGLRYKYFSASTMDPWTDLVGIPKSTTVENYEGNNVEAIELIPPADLVKNKYDVIFIDELNRAPPKVLNALLEVLQFKTINGNPMPFKAIWAAINPFGENDDYQVEMLDPAMEDRFQIQINMPYKLDTQLLKNIHGDIAETFINWWNSQPEDVQFKVSPRRISEAINLYKNGGDVEDIIYHGNVSLLNKELKENSETFRLLEAIEQKNNSVIQTILSRNISKPIEKVILKHNLIDEYFSHINKDWISSKVLSDTNIFERVASIAKTNDEAKNIISSIYHANPKSLFVTKNIETFKEFLDNKEVQKINDLIEELKNSPIEDNSVFRYSDSTEGKLLVSLKSKFYHHNNKLPALSGHGYTTIDKYIPFSLSQIVAKFDQYAIKNMYQNSKFSYSSYGQKFLESFALNAALLSHMADAKYKDKPNGVYEKFNNLFSKSSTSLFEKLRKENIEFKPLADMYEQKILLVSSFLNRLPDHENIEKSGKIANIHLVGLWINQSIETKKANSFEHFIYLYNANNNQSLASLHTVPKPKSKKV